MSISVWVVMGNDYPAAVFASEPAAGEFILYKKWDGLCASDAPHRITIHWRAYEFTLDQDIVPITLRPGQNKSPRSMTVEELRREWFYWYHREYGRQGAAASASSEFRHGVEGEFKRRSISIHENLVRHYHNLVSAERRSVLTLRKPPGNYQDW